MSSPTLIKKYGNRRLYDTGESCYITLEELSRKIRAGTDVRVVDAKSGNDLTQSTLTQIIVEGRGAARMLPVPLLTQLIRLGDDALAEFFGHYLSDALTLYLEMKRGASAVARYNPFAAMPLAASDALARLWMGGPFSGASRVAQPPPVWNPASSNPSDHNRDDLAQTPITSNVSADADNDDDTQSRTNSGQQKKPDDPQSQPLRTDQHDDELARLRREFDEFKRSMMQSSEAPARAQDTDAATPADSDTDIKPPTRKRKRKRKSS